MQLKARDKKIGLLRAKTQHDMSLAVNKSAHPKISQQMELNVVSVTVEITVAGCNLILQSLAYIIKVFLSPNDVK